jgi:hypothetical protein
MEGKTSLEEGGDMYLASTSTQSKSDVWFIESSASFHMAPHREWLCEYERCDGDVFLGDNWPTKIIGCGRVKMQLKNGRVKTLPGVLHIPHLAPWVRWLMQVYVLYLKRVESKRFEGKWC